jgi:glycosyltransferase involved in cell wall biosynthesis
VPSTNLVARIVDREGAGVVVDPRDEEAFVAAARRMLDQHAERERMAVRGRRYAERAFGIDRIADAFETVIDRSDAGD